MAEIDVLMELYFIHSPKSLSTTPGSGSFPSGWEAALVVSMSWLLMGLTVWSFMSPVHLVQCDLTSLT